MLLNELKKLLEEAMNSSGNDRIKAIKEFQDIVWDDTSIQNEMLNDILTDIAYNLDFYEPNDEWRKENPSFYGDDRLEKEVKIAIQKLQTLNPE
ncbi:MAG: hypothetical protein LBF27_28465 [Sphingobacterium sp.]|jgi:hypothetical protein|nr:hypothetical protein [Sphingobacterium sp.]